MWLQTAPEDTEEVPFDLVEAPARKSPKGTEGRSAEHSAELTPVPEVQSSLQRALSRPDGWPGLQLKEVEGAVCCKSEADWPLICNFFARSSLLPCMPWCLTRQGVGHDIGQFEAIILNEFLRLHASDTYFEVEGLEWDEFDAQIELDVGPPIPGINA